MATHINAFYADVEDKKLAVVRAQGELDAAVLALESHPDYVPEVKEAEKVEQEKSSEPAPQPQLRRR